MTKPLDEATKRLRSLSPAQLADEVGSLKAQVADRNDALTELKEEAIRRGLTEADGVLFRITLAPPGEANRFDKDALEAVVGADYLAQFTKVVATDWVLRCVARRQKAAKIAA